MQSHHHQAQHQQQSVFTHVDPTQILSPVDGGGEFAGPSPSSEEWRTTPSSTASPEPSTLNPQASSTGGIAPQGTGPNTAAAANALGGRKIASTKRTQNAARKAGKVPPSAATPSGVQPLPPIRPAPHRRSTADGAADGSQAGSSGNNATPPGEDGESPVCTNCSTTTTPLWRRDPDGQPLCTLFIMIRFQATADPLFLLFSFPLTGNACGLFYVRSLPSSSRDRLLIFD